MSKELDKIIERSVAKEKEGHSSDCDKFYSYCSCGILKIQRSDAIGRDSFKQVSRDAEAAFLKNSKDAKAVKELEGTPEGAKIEEDGCDCFNGMDEKLLSPAMEALIPGRITFNPAGCACGRTVDDCVNSEISKREAPSFEKTNEMVALRNQISSLEDDNDVLTSKGNLILDAAEAIKLQRDKAKGELLDAQGEVIKLKKTIDDYRKEELAYKKEAKELVARDVKQMSILKALKVLPKMQGWLEDESDAGWEDEFIIVRQGLLCTVKV